MSKVERSTITDYVTYADRRGAIREGVMETKRVRRIHVGAYLTFLFENVETMRYQIQEMMRVERMVRESDIQHELDTYNEVLGGPGELGCTLLIEIDDPAERDVKLTRWLSLPEHLYLRLESGEKVPATFDRRQVGSDRVSAVQYLKFDVSGRPPVGIGCSLDDPDVGVEVMLSPEQRDALEADLP
jgi:hypothetical protein